MGSRSSGLLSDQFDGNDRFNQGLTPKLVILVTTAALLLAALCDIWLYLRLYIPYISALVPGTLLGFSVARCIRIGKVRDAELGRKVAIAASGLYLLLMYVSVQSAMVGTAYHAMLVSQKMGDVAYPLFAAICTPLMVIKISRFQAQAAFCASCGEWLPKPATIAIAPVGLADRLESIIKSQNVEDALQFNRETCDTDLGSNCVRARGYQCSNCGCRMIDVHIKVHLHKRVMQGAVLSPVKVNELFFKAVASDGGTPMAVRHSGLIQNDSEAAAIDDQTKV